MRAFEWEHRLVPFDLVVALPPWKKSLGHDTGALQRGCGPPGM